MLKETKLLLAKLNQDYKKFYREEYKKFDSLNHCVDLTEIYYNTLQRLLKTIPLKKIGEGSSRRVFKLEDNLVLKVAMSRAGLAQNKLEYKLRNSEFVCTSYRKEPHELPAWLVSDYCTKPFKKHIKEQFNLTIKQFDDLLWNGKRMIKKGKTYTIKRNTDRAQHLLEFVVKNDLQPGDLMSHRLTANYGINPKGQLVITDAGLNQKVYEDYY